MLVNESTLRAVVRKYLLEGLFDDTTRSDAYEEFITSDPRGTRPDEMIYDPDIDGNVHPREQIKQLYDYVNQHNFQSVYQSILRILFKHEKDLNPSLLFDTTEKDIQSVYGEILATTLNRAAYASTPAKPINPTIANTLGLPSEPATTADATQAATATPTAAAGANKAFETSGPNYEKRKVDCVTKFVNLLKQYRLVNDSYVFPKESLINYQTAGNALYKLIDDADLYDPYKFKILASEYLKSCYRNETDPYLDKNFEYAYEHDQDQKLKAASTTPAPATVPAAAGVAPAAKPKPAADWDSYVRMTKDGAAVKQAWVTNASNVGGDISYYSFVNWYKTQMKISGRHLYPNEIISILQQTTPRAAAAPAAATAAASPPPAAPTPAAPTPAATPAASAATGTPPSSRRTDWIRHRANKKAARSSTLNKKADIIDKRKATK